MADDNNIVVEKTYNASPEKIWKALTDKAEMKKWYFDVSAFKPEIGFEFQFSGEGRKGEKYVHLCKVTEVIPEKKLTYSWSYEGREGMSFVTFELFPEGNTTKLILTHRGLDTFAKYGGDFAKSSFQEGWTQIIGTSLTKYLES